MLIEFLIFEADSGSGKGGKSFLQNLQIIASVLTYSAQKGHLRVPALALEFPSDWAVFVSLGRDGIATSAIRANMLKRNPRKNQLLPSRFFWVATYEQREPINTL